VLTARDITDALRRLGVDRADIVFLHSGLRRCLVVAGTTREQKLATLVRGMLDSVPDGALILPAFSYSFCRDQPFDVQHTPSRVGVLPEYFRRLPHVRRTPEPIFSTAVRGTLPAAWERRLFTIGDKDCFGDESVFALLLEADAKLVFLVADESDWPMRWYERLGFEPIGRRYELIRV
jgi:aminoglycoside 3-N-acetyltransferase